MRLTVQLSCLLALLAAGLGQAVRGPGIQDPGPWPLELKEAFALFQVQFNRSYTSAAEQAHRLLIFAHNLAQAQRLQEEDLGTAEFGVTMFSDLTEEEFGQLYGHRMVAGAVPNVSREAVSEAGWEPVPPSCDWRKARGVILPVRDQGNCMCCWAMAAAGNIEALWGIWYHKSEELSVQELLDCDRCNNGCNGGFVWDAFMTVLINRGLASEKDYPFQGTMEPQECLAKKYQKVAWIQDFFMLPANEDRIAQHLATHGPITVTINKKLLMQYKNGVIQATHAQCNPEMADHSVLLVGFGRTEKEEEEEGKQESRPRPRPHSSIPYWILKNSWGESWGERGYFRLHRGSNTCGLTKYPVSARVDLRTKKTQVSCPP